MRACGGFFLAAFISEEDTELSGERRVDRDLGEFKEKQEYAVLI